MLLIERGRKPQKGFWSLPGGAVQAGEKLEDAIRREVLEETGLRVKPREVVEVFERITPDAQGKPEYHYVLVDYLCKVDGGTLQAGDDASRVVWVKRSELGSYRMTEGSLEVIEKVFRQKTRAPR